MAKSSSRTRWLACCSCTGAIALLLVFSLVPLFLTSRRRLTHIGRRVSSSDAWNQSYSRYYWDSNRTQVFFFSNRSGQIQQLDDRTGRTTPLDPLPISARGSIFPIEGPRPSPDGKWLLFQPPVGRDYFALEVATQRTVHWKTGASSAGYILWFPDSRRWVEFDRPGNGRSTQPIIHSIDGPDRKTARISDILNWPSGTAPATHVLNAHVGAPVELWEYDLEANLPTAIKHRIAFPPGTVVTEVEGSPDGRSVAYLVQEQTMPFLTRLLGRFLPTSRESTPTTSLWVSRTDGSQLHRIGFETARSAAGVQWAPDGKRLSLFMNDGFYIVPVK